jgi:protein-tyrosine-phosphatase
METTILVLCGNDRCVAPASATVLRSALQAHGEWQVQVLSAGIRADVGRGWCREMSEYLTKDQEFSIRPHHAQQVTAELVRKADLVLVSERKYRGAARLLDAGSAPHTFTMVEAAALARAVLSVPSAGTVPPTTAGPDPAPRETPSRLGTRDRLVWLTAEMDAMRGLAPLPDEPHGWRRRLRGREEVVGIDILDPDDGRGSHRRVVPALREALDSFASSLAEAAPRPVPAPRPVSV